MDWLLGVTVLDTKLGTVAAAAADVTVSVIDGVDALLDDVSWISWIADLWRHEGQAKLMACKSATSLLAIPTHMKWHHSVQTRNSIHAAFFVA